MRPFKILLLLFCISLATQAQKVIENPSYGISSPEYIQLTKVELTASATILSLHIKIPQGNWVRIHDKSFIKALDDTTKHHLIKAEGIDMENRNYWEKDKQEEISCRLYFPVLDNSVNKIDFGEPVASSFQIFDIEIRESPNESILPNELLGNWFLLEKGNWTYSFLDTLAIFNNQIWKYHSFKKTNNLYEIVVSKAKKQKTLICEANNSNKFSIYEKGEKPQLYSNKESVYYKALEQKITFTTAHKPEPTIYHGIIKNYRPEIGTFVSLRYKNKTSNESFAKVADIEKDGSFWFELEINEPQEIDVNFPVGRGRIDVLPGTNLFQLVNSGNSDLPCLFMGESAMPALRQSIVRKFSNEIVFSNNLAAMSDTERDEFFKNARYDDIVGLKSLVLKDIKVKDNIFFVPRRSTKIYVKSGSRPHMSTVSSVGFWISNEITNKEYREFTNDIISNPENILRWEERKYNSSISSYEEFKAVEIYSEIARSLIDSALNVTVFYEKQLQKINIIKYLNDDKFNDFPAVGVPLKGAEYYCRWLNQKHGFTERSQFQLPNDINYRILADYLKEIRNSKNSPRIENILYKIPNDTIAYLNTNAKEWYRPNLQRSGKQYPPSKFAVLERWENFGDDIEYVYDDENSTVTGGFRIVRYSDENKAETINSVLIIVILLVIIILMTIVFLAYKWRVRQRFRKEEQNRKLRELELTAIRSQMNPHFLFNSLNSVQNLVQQNKGREAHLYLSDFAGLIRKVLNNSEKEEVSLAEELEMIQQYLNLEKLRFDFEFDINVAQEIDSHNTLVPSMLLQPFVENAVIHGLQSKPENRLLKIEITKEDKESGIKICIEDNGIGRAAAKEIAKAKNGKGTKLMRERLEILQEKQGEKYSLEIVDLDEGTRVEILIPEES